MLNAGTRINSDHRGNGWRYHGQFGSRWHPTISSGAVRGAVEFENVNVPAKLVIADTLFALNCPLMMTLLSAPAIPAVRALGSKRRYRSLPIVRPKPLNKTGD